jgi:L-threonylcarbamoyladenylate synthase
LNTLVIEIDPRQDDEKLAGRISGILLAAGVMAYPTETLYGLGAAALLSEAVGKIYRIKGRDPAKPLPLMASGLDMVREIAGPLPDVFPALAQIFWPGPLTLVLPASKALPRFIAGPGRTVAVRIPPVAWIRRLVSTLGQPLTATSANLSGRPATDDPREIRTQFEGRVDLIIDGGRTPGGAPSTIVDLSRGAPEVLREGAIPAEKVRALFPA